MSFLRRAVAGVWNFIKPADATSNTVIADTETTELEIDLVIKKSEGMRSSVAASGNYVYVVSGNTLYQFSVDGLKLVAKITLPTTERGGVDGSFGRGQGGGKQGRPDGIQK